MGNVTSLERPMLERCVKQDPEAFRWFVGRYQRAVFSLLGRMLGAAAPVEDLAQEVFLRAYRGFGSFDPTTNAITWLLTIATRLALDERKRRKLSLAPIEDADRVPGSDKWKNRELGLAIEEAANALSDDQRAAFVLLEFHGLSIAEISQIVGAPENTVKTRIFRAKEHMREALSAFAPGSAS